MIYQPQSHVYLRDDEFYELLSPKNIPHSDLLSAARKRGLLLSPNTPNADVRALIASLPSDWVIISKIYNDMARPDPDERNTTLELKDCAPNTDIYKLVTAVKTTRTTSYEEVYAPQKLADGTVRVEITYPEKNYSRAVPYQIRIKKAVIEITQKNGVISFVYSANQRARDIVDAMRAPIKTISDAEPAAVKVSLYAIRDPAVRSKFFLQLIKDIDGYRFEAADHVDVDRRLPDPASDEEDNGENGEEQEKETKQKAKKSAEVRSIVNRVALTGESVLGNDIYQLTTKSGYYISGIRWSCISKTDSRFHLDFEAGFIEPAPADQFAFDVSRQWHYKHDKPDVEEAVSMTREEKRIYTGLLKAAALRSYAKIIDENGLKKPV